MRTSEVVKMCMGIYNGVVDNREKDYYEIETLPGTCCVMRGEKIYVMSNDMHILAEVQILGDTIDGVAEMSLSQILEKFSFDIHSHNQGIGVNIFTLNEYGREVRVFELDVPSNASKAYLSDTMYKYRRNINVIKEEDDDDALY